MINLSRKNRHTARQAIIEAYQIRSSAAINGRIINLFSSLNGILGKTARKSVMLLAAEEFQKTFGLGRFAIFDHDHGQYFPIMSAGINLKSLGAFKSEELTSAEIRSNTPAQDRRRFIDPSLAAINPAAAAKLARLPDDFKNVFIFPYKFERFQLFFIGEDLNGELGRLCLNEEFNQAIWPTLREFFQLGQSLKKNHDYIRELEDKLSKKSGELTELSIRQKGALLEPGRILEISNKFFSVYNEDKLYEVLAESVWSMLSPSSLAVITPIDGNKFKIAILKGIATPEVQMMELPADSAILTKVMAEPPGKPVNLNNNNDLAISMAEQLLADGKKPEAVALYNQFKGDDQPKQVKVAATKGILTAAAKK